MLGGTGFLHLEEQGRVLDLHQAINILQTGLHELNFRFHRVVSKSDVLADNVLVGRPAVATEELYEFVFNILNEVQLRSAVLAHQKNRQEVLRLFYARVDHFD